MKIYKSQQEVEKDIKDEILNCNNEDVKFKCSISIKANIVNARNINARNINARDINAVDIDARNIDAVDINARNINARNIDAWDIDAENINARNINARNIDARNINVRNINAGDILYFAFCNAHKSIKCTSIKSKRDKYSEPICLDGELIIKKNKIETERSEKIILR